MSKRQMHLVAVVTTGPHMGSWLHPQAENDYLNGEWWTGIARTLEDAKFDAIFFADAQVFYGDEMVRKGGDLYLLDPVPLAAQIAAGTTKLGIGVTISTSLFQPYGIARAMGTLDVLSRGRMAWNVVTSVADREAHRYGMSGLLPKSERYDRADEVVEAAIKLWESFPADAYVADRKSGLFIDPERLDGFEYEGRYVSTQGPLTVPPSEQGRPMIMQAGSSPRGRDFAAKWAEIVFTYQRNAEGMQAFRADMNERLAKEGRAPEDCAILPSIQVIVGETEQIAYARRNHLYSLIDLDVALERAASYTGLDLASISPDATIDDLDVEGLEGSGALDVFLGTMKKEGLTFGETARRLALNDLGPELVGTPEQVADMMQDMFENWGNDGFIINPAVLPSAFEEFARSVVPILQERGLFRSDYSGSTLREHVLAPAAEQPADR
ncbi:NtaA/DmoA family FMN-dependent monooxygenase [Leucobacter tenebrionis]|uniref:NtaA/DmoA family FMN-dependent monooxygenase n=1 Tax=Leucobacter tenebrionis TaxID=2873270 RepID=UPI001CA69427|nr:NtaA/DmoA family FMN-dependent monooxygenase [Leucobacter tenebrionis]QZY51017.1 NtaA/DmoA family FMN-dependent monooxygenase [Leucobacter tenebrionis]